MGVFLFFFLSYKARGKFFFYFSFPILNVKTTKTGFYSNTQLSAPLGSWVRWAGAERPKVMLGPEAVCRETGS